MLNLFQHLLMTKNYYIYILTNFTNTTFYIGVTNNLELRVLQHKIKAIPGFTKKYNIQKLVYFEEYRTAIEAISREKQLKNWHRQWKLSLIKSTNPTLEDLS